MNYRLPDNNYTFSQKEYLKAWDAYVQSLEKIFTGYTVSAYDPAIVMTLWIPSVGQLGKVHAQDSITLSVHAANVLIEHFKE